MNSEKLTKKIMYEVAKKERNDLFISVFLLLPSILALIFIAIISSHRAINNLIDKGFMDLIVEFDFDLKLLKPQSVNVFTSLLQEAQRGFLAASSGSLAAIIVLFQKSKLLHLKSRIKWVKRYLDETNYLLLRINK